MILSFKKFAKMFINLRDLNTRAGKTFLKVQEKKINLDNVTELLRKNIYANSSLSCPWNSSLKINFNLSFLDTKTCLYFDAFLWGNFLIWLLHQFSLACLPSCLDVNVNGENEKYVLNVGFHNLCHSFIHVFVENFYNAKKNFCTS